MSEPCSAPKDKGGRRRRWGNKVGDRRWDQESVVTTSCLLHQENQLSRGTAEQSAEKYHVLREFLGPIFQPSSPQAHGQPEQPQLPLCRFCLSTITPEIKAFP